MSTFVPVVVGIADVVNRSLELKDAREPADLILQAIQDALDDANPSGTSKEKLVNGIGSVSIVRTWTWPYSDLPGLLSSRLGSRPKYKDYTENGGNEPAKLFDQAARRIAKGECEVAVVAGGEALASRMFSEVVIGKSTPLTMKRSERLRQSKTVTSAGMDSYRRVCGQCLQPYDFCGGPIHR